ncbi:MAG: hypothetical protein ACKV2U_11140 [Bryobacteraceae bacterium]
MATGSLQFDLTDLSFSPIQGKIHIGFQPIANTGGSIMDVDFDAPAATQFTVSNLECRSGPGTLYGVRIDCRNYRVYAFTQMIHDGVTAKASDNKIRLAINPSRVKDIAAPPLHPSLQAILPSPTFFDSLDPFRKACLLNVFARAQHASAARSFRFVESLIRLDQDRVFCTVAPEIEAFLVSNNRFKSAPDTLHKPLPGFELRASFKSRDANANIQFTLMREVATGRLAADIDIDESSGIEHGFEVFRNHITGGKTNPYQVHQLLLLTELDPGYQLLLR